MITIVIETCLIILSSYNALSLSYDIAGVP